MATPKHEMIIGILANFREATNHAKDFCFSKFTPASILEIMRIKKQGRLQNIYQKSNLKPPYNSRSLVRRLWVYQNERVPIIALFIMGWVLYAAVASATQQVFNWGQVLLATTLSTLYFIQIRLNDEPKDFEHDTRYHTGRPVQRGLVTLWELRNVRRAVVVLFLGVGGLSGSPTIVALVLAQQACAYLTQKEFFVRDWLRRHFIAYQLLHYSQLLLLGWLTTTVVGIDDINQHLLYYGYVLSMSMPIELSRTIGGIDDKAAADRYSHQIGTTAALTYYFTTVVVATVYTLVLSQQVIATSSLFLLVFGLLAIAYAALRYIHQPIVKNATILNISSIIFYLASTGTLLFA